MCQNSHFSDYLVTFASGVDCRGRVAANSKSMSLKKARNFILALLPILFCLLAPEEAKAEGNDYALPDDSLALSVPILVFDSVRTTDFFPYFPVRPLTFHSGTAADSLCPTPTRWQARYEQAKMKEKMRHRIINQITLDAPQVIEYYNLKPYNSNLDKFEVEEHELRISGLEPMGGNPKLDDLKKYIRQKENSPWTFDGSLAVQFSQYYVTDNWYKGGNPNATFLTIFDYNIDYHKDRLLWENDFDVKIGFYNTSEDTIRAFRVNNDLVRLSSLIAYQTWFYKKMYYSASVDFNTSLFTGYKTTNSNEVVAAFLSPSRMFLSLGLECRYNKKTSIRVAPFAYKLIFLTDDRIDPLTVGIDSTKSYANYPGYMVQAKLDWKFSKEINLTSKIDFFSSYDSRNLEFDWEVVGKFIINRYLSTRLSLIMRYDNTPKDEEAQIQVQEQLSFGFNYVFR